MTSKIFVVTGGNKGIGYGIVETLAQKVESSIIYLTARDKQRGETAVESLNESLGDKRKSEIKFHSLDITNENSGKEFANYLKQHHNGLDILINNAGIAFSNAATDPADVQANVTIATNYYGTKLISSILVPLIRDGGRVVNVCSQMGIMKGRYDQKHIDNLHNAKDENIIDEFVEEFKKRSKDGTRVEGGFPDSAYQASKAAEIALTMVYHHRYKNLIVNACCPGFVDTDMTNHKGRLTIQEGADTPVYLAIDNNVPNGKFVHLRKPIEW